MNPFRISQTFKRFVRMSGLPEHCNIHGLRHSFGTDLLRRGVPINRVSEMMGHSTIEITKIYQHLTTGGISMKALEILMTDLGDTTKNHILLWGNLYKGSGFRSLIPSVDDLFDLILVTEEFNEVVKSEIDGRLKYSKSTPDFTRRIKQLKKINKQRLAKWHHITSRGGRQYCSH